MTEHFFLHNKHIQDVIKEVYPLIITDCNYTIKYVNKAFCQLVKYEEGALLNEHVDILNITPINEEDRPFLDEKIFMNKNLIKKEVEYLDKDDNVFWASVSLTYLLDEDQQIESFVILFTEHLHSGVTKHLPIHPFQFLQTLEIAVNESSVVLITDKNGKILSVNKKYTELTQYTAKEVIGKNPSVAKSGYQPKEFYKKMWQTIMSGEIWNGELRNRAKDGSLYWVRSTTVPILNKLGEPVLFIAIQTDITRRMEAEKSLQRAVQNEFDKTVRNLYNVVFKYEADGAGIKFTLLEGKMVKKLNLSLEGMTMDQIADRHQEKEARQIKSHLYLALEGRQTHFEVDLYDYSLLVHLSPIYEANQVREVVGTIVDITNRKKAENLAKQMAYYDFLTNLPNRRYLQKKADEFIFEHESNSSNFAVMFIDINRFKNINDSMGHSAGDQLLIQIAQRLQKIVRKDDFVARLGGDEFIVLFPNVNREEAEVLVKHVVKNIKAPFKNRDLEVFISASIGISIFPHDGNDFDSIIGSADIAMYNNKKELNNDYQFFDRQLRQDVLERSMLEMDMQNAIERKQFELHYQPKYDLNTKEMTGVEALIRWNHPVKGFIPPSKFIPVAEDTGTIIPLGKWVLERSCKQLKEWHDAGYNKLTMAVNISIAQFNHPKFVHFIEQALEEVGLESKYLNIEITESMMLDKRESEAKLKSLRDLGVEISIDDFGTGYSSLSYLSSFPFTHLKIDQSFIREFTESNKAIIQTIISLAKALHVRVVAEGVEEEIHEAFLESLKCDEVQGYFYAKPMLAEKLENLLKRD